MVAIFISHAWSESAVYGRFVCSLNQILGEEAWRNLSVPSTEAIDVVESEQRRMATELPRLEEELWRAEAMLRDPNLREAISLTVWRDGGPIELPTTASVRQKIDDISARIEKIKKNPSDFIAELPDVKDASSQIRKYPELSAVIRERIISSDIVFILITQGVRIFHEFVDHELRLSKMLNKPTIGIKAGTISRDLYIDCDTVIEWDNQKIFEVVESIKY